MNDVRPLLVSLLLATTATLLAFVVRGAGIALDVVPIASVFVITLIAYVRWRRSAPPLLFFIALSEYFAGALVAVLGANHLTAVVYSAIQRARQDRFVYDFRFYALLLLGVLLVTCGALATRFAVQLLEQRVVRASIASWLALLVINLPLVPIQRFAILFSVVAVIELLLLLHLHRTLRAHPTRAGLT